MIFEIFTAAALNASGSPNIPPTQSTPFVFLAVGALLISLSTLGFTIWNASRTRRSEQLKIARELMYRILDSRHTIDSLHDKRHGPQEDDENMNIKSFEWVRSISDLMNDIEEFKAYSIIEDIENRSDILLYKIRIHAVLEHVLVSRRNVSLEQSDAKSFYDQWISELEGRCKKGNEKRFAKVKAKTRQT
jgi:hypothetical protein